jgi:hypothetical protein
MRNIEQWFIEGLKEVLGLDDEVASLKRATGNARNELNKGARAVIKKTIAFCKDMP